MAKCQVTWETVWKDNIKTDIREMDCENVNCLKMESYDKPSSWLLWSSGFHKKKCHA
jgi:hypothetical protein